MVGSVRVAWYNSFHKSALSRGYKWDLTIEDIDALYNIQRGRCALSGRHIGWSEQKWDHTASIDRINNDIGYTLDNIQLVHKQINMMRGTLSIEEFIKICKTVANKVKW